MTRKYKRTEAGIGSGLGGRLLLCPADPYPLPAGPGQQRRGSGALCMRTTGADGCGSGGSPGGAISYPHAGRHPNAGRRERRSAGDPPGAPARSARPRAWPWRSLLLSLALLALLVGVEWFFVQAELANVWEYLKHTPRAAGSSATTIAGCRPTRVERWTVAQPPPGSGGRIRAGPSARLTPAPASISPGLYQTRPYTPGYRSSRSGRCKPTSRRPDSGSTSIPQTGSFAMQITSCT